MVYFITALHFEAMPFITRYRMKKILNHQNKRFDLFKSQNNNQMLIITGVGEVKAVTATAYLLTLYPPSDGDLLVNVGVCGGDGNYFDTGCIIMCNKLVEANSKKCFYPHILKKHPFIESELCSSSEIVKSSNFPTSDMEAVYIYQTASMFMQSEQIVVIKVISDLYETNFLPNKDFVNRLMTNNVEKISNWIDSYINNELEDLPTFSHIYIENKALDYDLTKKIKVKFNKSEIIHINHYKDVFSPKNQNFSIQKKSRKLILAVKTGKFLYEGSILCDNFGNDNFYYTADMLNCIYDCDYCYLQGLYPSANIVLFVNIEDTFAEVEKQLMEKPLYICISYNTDLLALENITEYTRKWLKFAENHDRLSIEIRTKSVNFKSISDIKPNKNVVFAWTVSPDIIAKKFEHNVPETDNRLKNLKEAIANGWNVRICIDPVICIDGYMQYYNELKALLPSCMLSVGTFRVPQSNFKKMKKLNDGNELYEYNFVQENGYIGYKHEDILKIYEIFN